MDVASLSAVGYFNRFLFFSFGIFFVTIKRSLGKCRGRKMDELRNFSSSWNYFGNNYCADILLLLYCSALLLFNRSESLLEFRSNISQYSDVLFQYNRISLNFRFTRSKELLFFFLFFKSN